MRYGSLFSGYGGLDLAVEAVFGAKAAWHAEIEPAPCRVLEARWPGVPNLGDVAKVDWSTVERPEIMCGGFPCTDLSAAGRTAGLKPGTRSGLWSEFARGIKALQPELVVIENVRGLLSTEASHPAHQLGFCPGCLGDDTERVVLRALGAVLGDLADLGFDAEWCGLPASGVGAAHPRYRIVILAWPALANADRDRCEGWAERDGEAGGRLGREQRNDADGLGLATQWGAYGPAIDRWGAVIGRAAPVPTMPGRNGQPKLSPIFVEWLMGLPAGWVTDVGATTNEALKMLGNGVVPQQAEAGIRYLLGRIGTA